MALVQCVQGVGEGGCKGRRRASAEVVENIASSIHKCANAYPTSHVCVCVCLHLSDCFCACACQLSDSLVLICGRPQCH